MPANLTPQYYEAEKQYRQARTASEKIIALETMLAIMPKHKGTDKLKADLRRKISQLKDESIRRSGGKRGQLFEVEKNGAGQVVVVGFPNVGKSQLVDYLTLAKPEVGEYPYTTHAPIPGMMQYENIQIQLVDIPSILDESARGWLLNIVRNADALLLVADLTDDPDTQVEILLEELERYKVRPQGAKVAGEPGFVERHLMVVANKLDREGADAALPALREKFPGFNSFAVSALKGEHMENLRQEIFNLLGVARVHTKAPGKDPDLQHPVILPKGSTVLDFAAQVHKDFARNLQFARIWGSGKFDGQRVQRDCVLQDGDIVELHI